MMYLLVRDVHVYDAMVNDGIRSRSSESLIPMDQGSEGEGK